MNEADRTFLSYLIRANQEVAVAAAKVIRDGDDKNVRALAQSETNENKAETPKLQAALKSGTLSPMMGD